jgi:hypothetical protein
MTNRVRLFALLAVMLAAFLQAQAAQAQASRTWVASNGDDANPCTRTLPCRTIAGTMSKTATGGEIDFIDPNGVGSVNIARSITIDGGNSQGANITAPGVDGIIVQPNAGTVILRNLRINGVGTGLDGITVKSGSLVVIENCEIYDFSTNGITIAPSTGTVKVVIANTRILGNGQGGIQIKPTGGATTVSASDVVTSGNGFGIGVDTTGGGTASVIVDHVTASENSGNGLQASGTGTTVEVGFSTLAHNGTGVNVTAPANVFSFQNNIIAQSATANVSGTFGMKPLQ